MTATTLEAAIQAWVAAGTGLSGSQVRWAQQSVGQERPMVTLQILAVERTGHDWTDVAENALVVADDVAESVDATANTVTLTAHGLLTGDGPLRWTTTGTLPAPLAPATDYWVIKVSANAIKLAASFADAMAASPVAINLTDTGTGTHTLSDTSVTRRAGAEILHTGRGTRRATLSIQAFAADAVGATSPRAYLEALRASAVLPSQKARLEDASIGLAPLGPVTAIDGIIGSSLFDPRATLEATLFLVSEVSESGTYIETVQVTNLDTSAVFDVP